jgi:hypothetical protein
MSDGAAAGSAAEQAECAPPAPAPVPKPPCRSSKSRKNHHQDTVLISAHTCLLPTITGVPCIGAPFDLLAQDTIMNRKRSRMREWLHACQRLHASPERCEKQCGGCYSGWCRTARLGYERSAKNICRFSNVNLQKAGIKRDLSESSLCDAVVATKGEPDVVRGEGWD